MPKRSRRKREQHSGPVRVLPSNVRLTVDPDRLVIVYTNKRWLMGVIFATFTTLFLSIVARIPADMIQRGVISNEIFYLIPFGLVSIILFGVVLRCFFHRETLSIDANGLNWKLFLPIPAIHRHISWEHLIGVRQGRYYDERKLIRGWGAGIETDSELFYLFLDMPPSSESKALRQELKRFIAEFRVSHGVTVPVRGGETEETAIRRFESIHMIKTPEFLKIEGSPPIGWEHKFFSLLFMLGWTVGCSLLPYMVFSPKGDMPMWGRLLFLGVFWGSWLVVIPVLLRRNWSWESLQVEDIGVKYKRGIRFCGIFIPFKKRFVPIDEVGLASIDDCRDAHVLESDMVLPATGRPIRCFNAVCKTTSAAMFLLSFNNRLKRLGVTENIIDCFMPRNSGRSIFAGPFKEKETLKY